MSAVVYCEDELGRTLRMSKYDAYIHSVFVPPAARGRAVAPVMLEHLAKELRISNSRVCDLVEHMVEQGLLREDAAAAHRQRRGRRGVSVGLNPGFGHLLGFDMEAKRLRLVVTNFRRRSRVAAA